MSAETPNPRKDPKRWVDTGQRVEAHYAIGDGVAAVGRVIGYCDAPTVTIETDDGRQVSWRVDLTEVEEQTAESGAEYVFRSNLRTDGASFLSLHRLGDDVHLRIRHMSSAPLTFEVAVLSPYERRALITALSEFDAESAARPQVRVPNEPHGPSPEVRREVAALVLAGDMPAAVKAVKEAMHWLLDDAHQYVRDMSEYQTYLSEHGEKREARTLFVHPQVWKPLVSYLDGIAVEVFEISGPDDPQKAYAMKPSDGEWVQ